MKFRSIALALALSACAVPALADPVADFKSCISTIYGWPQIAPLRNSLPMNVNDATLVQLSNRNLATDEEIRLIMWFYPSIQYCRQQVIAQLPPALVPIAIDGIASIDESLVRLVQKQVSWGDFLLSWRQTARAGQMAELAANQQLALRRQAAIQNSSNILTGLANQMQARTDALNSSIRSQPTPNPGAAYPQNLNCGPIRANGSFNCQ
jgi:hypothetical protein